MVLYFHIIYFFYKSKTRNNFFFIFNLIVFFSINKDLWGVAKYSLEYLIPFIILGHLIFFKYFIKKKKYLIVNTVNILIIILNIYEIKKFPESNISFDQIQERGFFLFVNNNFNKNTKYVTKIPYRYNDAYDYISEIKAKDQTLLLGSDYGFLPQIISNYSYNDLTKIINLKYQYDIATGNINSNVSKIHSIISKNHNNQSNNLEKNKKKTSIFKYEVENKKKLLVKKTRILLII